MERSEGEVVSDEREKVKRRGGKRGRDERDLFEDIERIVCKVDECKGLIYV